MNFYVILACASVITMACAPRKFNVEPESTVKDLPAAPVCKRGWMFNDPRPGTPYFPKNPMISSDGSITFTADSGTMQKFEFRAPRFAREREVHIHISKLTFTARVNGYMSLAMLEEFAPQARPRPAVGSADYDAYVTQLLNDFRLNYPHFYFPESASILSVYNKVKTNPEYDPHNSGDPNDGLIQDIKLMPKQEVIAGMPYRLVSVVYPLAIGAKGIEPDEGGATLTGDHSPGACTPTHNFNCMSTRHNSADPDFIKEMNKAIEKLRNPELSALPGAPVPTRLPQAELDLAVKETTKKYITDMRYDYYGGFPFLRYTNRSHAMHGPITLHAVRTGFWDLRRGPVSHGCNRMEGEHILELTALLGCHNDGFALSETKPPKGLVVEAGQPDPYQNYYNDVNSKKFDRFCQARMPKFVVHVMTGYDFTPNHDVSAQQAMAAFASAESFKQSWHVTDLNPAFEAIWIPRADNPQNKYHAYYAKHRETFLATAQPRSGTKVLNLQGVNFEIYLNGLSGAKMGSFLLPNVTVPANQPKLGLIKAQLESDVLPTFSYVTYEWQPDAGIPQSLSPSEKSFLKEKYMPRFKCADEFYTN